MKKVARTLMNGYVQFEDGTYGWYSPFKEEYVQVHEDEATAHEPELYFDDDDDDDEEPVEKWFYDLYEDDEKSPYLLDLEEIQYADNALEQIWRDSKSHSDYYDYYNAFMTDLTVDIATATEVDDYSALDILTRVWIDCRALES